MVREPQIEFSLVVPVFKNEGNIPDLIATINNEIMPAAGGMAEAVFVVDGSPDRSGDLLREALSKQEWPAQLVMHSRNFGSVCAIRSGIAVARGKAIAVMAADLQEPPSLVGQFWKALSKGEADIVFGQRTKRHDDRLSAFFSSTFWWLYRRLVFPDMPSGGIDVFAVNDRVRKALLEITEPNSSLIAQLFWVGFRRAFVPYERQTRRVGTSAWTLRRRLDYMVDSVVGFSDLPIMFQIWLGAFGVTVSSLVAVVVLLAWLAGWITVGGYTPIMLMLAFGFSVLLVSQGVQGLYLWRTFENSKRRPLAVICEHLEFEGSRT